MTPSSPVLVTGGSGFIAGHCILQLLDAGRSVRATLRSTSREASVRETLQQAGATNLDRLEFVAADLTSDDGWDAAMDGVDAVLHVASPVMPGQVKDEQTVISPAREGAVRVIEAARRAGARRVVLTSAFHAAGFGHGPIDHVFTEDDWSPLDGPGMDAYGRSKVLAERAVASMQQTAQLTTVVKVDVTKVAAYRSAVQADFVAKTGGKLSFLPFFVLAAAEALKAYPVINATVHETDIVYPATENISIAVDTERGLLTPVVKNAGDLNVAGLARAIADVADRTRNNKITPDDLSGGTFTITNTGSRGALFDTPILNQPQVAMLGTGAIVRRPVVITTDDGGETLAIRSMMYLALTYDHRVVDGADAARFLGTVKARLEEGRFEA